VGTVHWCAVYMDQKYIDNLLIIKALELIATDPLRSKSSRVDQRCVKLRYDTIRLSTECYRLLSSRHNEES